MTAYEAILNALADNVVSRNGDQAQCRCPAHEDHNPSLSVGVRQDGKGVVVRCHRGCTGEQIVAAIGWTEAMLFDSHWQQNGHRQIVATYNYLDEQAQLLYQVVRFEPKGFAQRRPDGAGGWVWNLNDTRRVLLWLPRVLAAVRAGRTIYVVEGEKDVEAFARAYGRTSLGRRRHKGIVATTNPGGAGKWRSEYSEQLCGANVIIVADRDETGREHARAVAESLQGVAASVKVVEPAVGKDAHDHLMAGKTVEDFVESEVSDESEPLKESDSSDTPSGDDEQPSWQRGDEMNPCAVPLDRLPTVPGFPFMLEGTAAVVSGPTGGGRSSFAQACAYDAALAGLRVMYLGGEVTLDEFNTRAALLARKRGHDAEGVRDRLARVRYLDLTDTLATAWTRREEWIAGVGEFYNVVIIDPLGDALEAVGLEDKNADYRRFYLRLIEPLRNHGVAVVMLDNVGHAEDAQGRPIGPSAKRHKADLEFSSVVQDSPLALRLTATKVRPTLSPFSKGTTWTCDEAMLMVTAVEGLFTPTKRKSRHEQRRDQRAAAVLKALAAKAMSVRELAAATSVPKSSVQDLLDWLEQAGRVAMTPDGWTVSETSDPLKDSDSSDIPHAIAEDR